MLTDAWLSAAAVVLLFVVALTARWWAPPYIVIGRSGPIYSPAIMRALQQQNAFWTVYRSINSTTTTDYSTVRRR